MVEFAMPPIEPSSDMRQLAIAIRQMYLALTGTGFDPDQALHLTSVWVTAMVATTPPKEGQ